MSKLGPLTAHHAAAVLDTEAPTPREKHRRGSWPNTRLLSVSVSNLVLGWIGIQSDGSNFQLAEKRKMTDYVFRWDACFQCTFKSGFPTLGSFRNVHAVRPALTSVVPPYFAYGGLGIF
jgi:hypothetical protein